MQIDADAILLFVKEFKVYGMWGLVALAFVIWGMRHVAPIITAIGTVWNERHRANLAHKRSMIKLQNKKSQNKGGKGEG